MVDGGATHNFIDTAMVDKMKLLTKSFDGFTVITLVNHSMDCKKWIPKLQVTIGDYTITDTFYVVDVVETNVVFGFQWLFSIGEHTVNYQVP